MTKKKTSQKQAINSTFGFKAKHIFIASLLVAGFGGCAYKEDAQKQKIFSQEEIEQEAQKAIQLVGGTLLKALHNKIDADGIEKAASFCSLSANKLAKEASEKLPHGVTVKRITQKPRNSNSLPTGEHLAVLEQLQKCKDEGYVPSLLFKQKDEKHFYVYKPIMMQSLCLQCHGKDFRRDKKAYETILKHYPDDKAIGYGFGDFRGAFLVEIQK